MKNPELTTSTNHLITQRALRAAALGAMFVVGVMTTNSAPRAITDLTSRQGTYCLQFDTGGNVDCAASGYHGTGCTLFVPPQPNVGGWSDPRTAVFSLVDYAGLVDGILGGALGTSMSGSINEIPLADGRAEVSILLHTQNAFVWASDISTSFPGPILFGNSLAEVLNGKDPALGDSLLQVTFKNTAPGAPLPDLIQLLFCPTAGQELTTLSFRARAVGTLRAASGVSDGTPGRLEITQAGLIGIAGQVNSNSRVALDAFPADHITIQPTSGH
jgi:hypothetical protein